MKYINHFLYLLILVIGLFTNTKILNAQVPIVPSNEELYSPFGDADADKFRSPDKVFYPET